MINKGTFAYAITEIDDDLILAYAPSERAYTENIAHKKVGHIIPIAAAVGVAAVVFILISLGLFKRPPNTDYPLASESSACSGDDIINTPETGLGMHLARTARYPNYSDECGLIKVRTVKNCGIFYIGRGYYKPLKCLIYEAVVEKDYYCNFEEGETLHVCFYLDYPLSRGVETVSIDEQKLTKVISSLDSFIFYTSGKQENEWFYPTEKLGKNGEKETRYLDLCYCMYAGDGVIPIVDSKVDYTGLDRVVDLQKIFNGPLKNGMFLTFFNHFNKSPYSICQGDSLETVNETIEKLFKYNYIGGYYKNENGEYIYRGHRVYTDSDLDIEFNGIS